MALSVGFFAFKTQDKNHTRVNCNFASSHSPSVGQGGLFWVSLSRMLEDGGERRMLCRDAGVVPQGCGARAADPHPLPLDVAELSLVQLESPLGQQQLDTFCRCSLFCVVWKFIHLDLLQQKYFSHPFSFSLVLSCREMPSWSFTASSDQLPLGSQLLAFSWSFVHPQSIDVLIFHAILNILESKIELVYVKGKDVISLEKEQGTATASNFKAQK